jgi:hypothetical protein
MDVPVDRANVLLVDHVDQPDHEVVVEPGRINLRVPADANPAVRVVEQSESIRDVVLESTR